MIIMMMMMMMMEDSERAEHAILLEERISGVRADMQENWEGLGTVDEQERWGKIRRVKR
jgi:hypothetical protein